MRRIGKSVRTAAWAAALTLMAMPGVSAAAGHEGMAGMQHGDHSGMKMEGHDMTAMGEKAFSGKIGPWTGEARIMDMKARMGASGMKTQGAMPNSHHVALSLKDASMKPVTEGKGTVLVVGPDGKSAKADFMVMQGHFGADVNLAKPGKYMFTAQVESGGKKGSAKFSYTVK